MASPASQRSDREFKPSMLQRLAGWLADSPMLSRGRALMERNRSDYYLALSKWGKLSAGGYLILKDYSAGAFPPTFADQALAYQGEIDYFGSMPGADKAQVLVSHTVKPFWGSASFDKYSRDMTRLLRCLEQLNLRPGASLLELGCGCGWMTEFLAISGYRMLGTTIAPDDVAIGEKRSAALGARGLSADNLLFQVAPMETVDEVVGQGPAFDGVFVFEALHHAFDWRRAIHAASRCLKPGGWLLLANEPNLLHTFVSYRIARLTNTHEIGMSQGELINEMRLAGLKEVRIFAPRFDNRVSAHWIAARK